MGWEREAEWKARENVKENQHNYRFPKANKLNVSRKRTDMLQR